MRFALLLIVAVCLYGPYVTLPHGADFPEHLSDAEKLWSGDFSLERAERPLVTAYVALFYPVFGESPVGWHILSILLHAVCVWLIARRWGIASGILFAICVSGSQAVLWTSAISYPLALAFCLLAIGGKCSRRYRADWRKLAFWTLAGLAHPIAIGPAMWRLVTSVSWWLYEFWWNDSMGRTLKKRYLRPCLTDLTPITCLLTVATCALLFPSAPQWSASRLLLEPGTVALDAELGWLRPLVNLLWYAGATVTHFVYPLGTFLSRPDFFDLFAGAVVLGVGFWKWPKWTFWMVCCLIPVVFEPSVWLASRYLYLPAVAVCVVAGQWMEKAILVPDIRLIAFAILLMGALFGTDAQASRERYHAARDALHRGNQQLGLERWVTAHARHPNQVPDWRPHAR